MTIKEIEDRTGLPRANIRFYESQGLIAPSRGENGYRDYSQEDCQTLLKIKLLRKLDCSLEDIRSLQAGERSLDQLLEQRLAQLEGRYAAGGPGGLVLHGPGPLSLLGPFHPSG